MILAGYYTSTASANQDLALDHGGNRLGPYALGWDPSTGKLVVFTLRSDDPAKALIPLERFGFALSTARGASPTAEPTRLPSTALQPNEQKFIDRLAAVDITPTKSEVSLAGLGWAICGDLFLGRTQTFEANRVYAYNPELGGNGARAVVQAAVDILCPEAAVQHNPPPYPPKFNIP